MMKGRKRVALMMVMVVMKKGRRGNALGDNQLEDSGDNEDEDNSDNDEEGTAWQCTRRQPGVARVKFRARRAAGNKVTLGKTSSASAPSSSSIFPLKSVIINPPISAVGGF